MANDLEGSDQGTFLKEMIADPIFGHYENLLKSVIGDTQSIQENMWKASGEAFLRKQDIDAETYNFDVYNILVDELFKQWEIDKDTASDDVKKRASEIALSLITDMVSGLGTAGIENSAEVKAQVENY